MRTRHRCPKCDHGEVLYIPEPRDTDQDRMALGATLSAWTGEANGQLEAYVCLKCGFTELYVKDVNRIALKKIDGAQVLQAEVRSDPYRSA